MNRALILYRRDGCGLCEHAAAIARAAGARVREVDIATDLELLERYRDRIPVLQHPATGAELGWPFDPTRVTELLDADEIP